jgi:hypothetical protein
MSTGPGFSSEFYEGQNEPPETGKGAFDPRFKLTPFDEITLPTDPDSLVQGILPRTGLAVIWGAFKCGKSFWLFDVMMHVAIGWFYRGRRVQQGPVVYIALEGVRGFRKRVVAWRIHHLAKHQGRIPFYLLGVSLDIIKDHDKLILAIRAQLGEQMPVAVVIDTLNRALVGDESNSRDMGNFVRAADAISAAFQCLVPIVHHCGWDGSRPRGFSGLPGADEAQISVTHDENTSIIAVKVEHAKEFEAGAEFACRLIQVPLGTDKDGEKITSCVAVPVEGEAAAAKPGKKLLPAAVAGLRSLHDCLADIGCPAPSSDEHIPKGVTTVSFAQWREYLLKHSIIEGTNYGRVQFHRIRVTLKNAGKIGIWGDFVWSVSPVSSRFKSVSRNGPLGEGSAVSSVSPPLRGDTGDTPPPRGYLGRI